MLYYMELTEEEKELIDNFRNNKKVKELEEELKNKYNWTLESEGIDISVDGEEEFEFSNYINYKKWCILIYEDGDICIYESGIITGETPKLSDEEKNIFKEIIKYKYFKEK